jgi:tyrosine-protein kinase Etk/Wzc
MQRDNNGRSPDENSQGRYERSISEYYLDVLKHRRDIGYAVGAAFILSIIFSLLLPKMYLATAVILPPREDNTGLVSLLSRIDEPLSGLTGGLIGNQSTAALYEGILRSRNVANRLIKEFKLKEVYDLKYVEDVYEKLEDRSTIRVSKKDQMITVSVEDRDRQRAADMANAYVEMLDRINRELNINQGKRKRLFLEDRLKKVRAALDNAESDLKTFQEKHHIVAIEEQAKVAIQGAAEIKAQIIEAQTELEIFKQFGTEKQAEAVMLKAKIIELKRQLESIEQSAGTQNTPPDPSPGDKGSEFYIPFNDLPHLGMQFMRLTREAKIQGKLFELLTAQYEMAQIEEARDVGTIQVIDHAVAPERKYRPHRARIVITSTILVFFIAVLAAIAKESRWDLRKIL